MKIKFARTLAIASALSVAFAGLTAFAAPLVPTVETITTYDHAASTDVTVTTTIKGLSDNTEVAYYVCEEGTAGAVTDKIVYIDQATFDADAADGLVFTFTDTKADFLKAMAKFGSNEGGEGATFPTFYFNEGTNYLTQVAAQVEKDATIWNQDLTTAGITVTDADVDATALAFKGKVRGAAKAYGVKITTTGVSDNGTSDTYYFPAYGCGDDGSFVVIIEGYTPSTGDTIDVYVE